MIPLGAKDMFNATRPADDLANFGSYVLNSELAGIFTALFGDRRSPARATTCSRSSRASPGSRSGPAKSSRTSSA